MLSIFMELPPCFLLMYFALTGLPSFHTGVQTFCPRPVARMLDNVGGISCLLGLVAMASDVEGMYAAVKALVCVVRSNPNARWDMDRIRGYQVGVMLQCVDHKFFADLLMSVHCIWL